MLSVVVASAAVAVAASNFLCPLARRCVLMFVVVLVHIRIRRLLCCCSRLTRSVASQMCGVRPLLLVFCVCVFVCVCVCECVCVCVSS
ncbi:MAG TPA: hypothetical protein V6C97_01305 [Oculatellaceae cyanobacterium]